MEEFISIKNFKHLFKLLNRYSQEKYNKKLDFKVFKRIIGNSMYEIDNNFKDKITLKRKNIMIITLLKQIIDEKNQVDDFFKMENSFYKEDEKEVINNYQNVIDFKEKPTTPKKEENILVKRLDNERKIYEKIINTEENKIDKQIIQENNIEKYRKEMIMERQKTEPINLEENIKNMNQEILINPDEYKKTLNKYIVKYDLLIDSRDINQDNYELNNYILDLNNEINNIFAIELLDGIFPNSEYIVNENNNILHIEEVSGTIEEIEIPIGNYTKSELLTQLQISLNSSLSSNYTISTNNVGVKLNNNETDDSNFTDYTGINIYNIFDNNLSTYWESDLSVDNPSFFIYDFKKNVNIKEYSFISKVFGRPKDFSLEVSNDGVTWNVLHSVINQTTSSTKYKTYSFSNNTLHTRYVKFSVTNSSNGNNVKIAVNEMIFKTYRDDIISIQSDLTGGESNYFNLRFFGGYDVNGLPKYLDRSIGKLIGYDPIDLLNYSSYSSQNKVVLKNDESLIILNINENDLLDYHILLDSNKNEYTYIKQCDSQIKQLDKLETFRKLKITIKRNNNNFYYFNGLEHSYLLRIYYYNTNQVFKDTL